MPKTHPEPKSRRPRLLSAAQAGWALTLATAVSLVVGLWVVRGLGGGHLSPPLEIESDSTPATAPPEPTFQILAPDDPAPDAAAFRDASPADANQRRRWAESFRPQPVLPRR